MKLSKKQLRAELLRQRSALNRDEFELYSKQVCNAVIESEEFNQAEVIHCYVPIISRNELNTFHILEESLSRGKKLVVPRIKSGTTDLDHVWLKSPDVLKPNKWGVPEPESGGMVDLSELQLILVPVVGCDVHRNRIGYGKGFYDRFLAEVTCPAFGLTFEQSVCPEIPIEQHDIKLDRIFTEKRII